MRLVVFSHKPCWPCANSLTGYATDGGFPFQMAAIAELFDETVLLVPCHRHTGEPGEIPLGGPRLRVSPLPQPYGSGLGRKMLFPLWFFRCAPAILREFRNADAVHAPIPGDVGTVGMLLAWLFRKPLFVRHCGNWLRPTTLAEKFWRWFMETSAGGRNVMLATGGAAESPSRKNPNVHWIFSTSLTQQELQIYAGERAYPADGQLRLIIVARQEKAKGAGTVIQCLRLLVKRFPGVSFDIVGEGSAIPEFKKLASEAGVAERVHFSGKLNHEQVMQRLRDAHLFVFPTTSSDGFPKVVLEALASGLPVVATKVSVLPQLLGNGSGVLINEATPEAVARGVEQALSDPDQYQAMSRKAIETARQYSLEAWRDTIGGYLSAAWGPLRSQ
jgi:glycosyltransferase involved in cell wall biosynthesis